MLEGEDKDKIFDQLCKQQVEIVFTAHPTEVNRRTILRKFRKVRRWRVESTRKHRQTLPPPSLPTDASSSSRARAHFLVHPSSLQLSEALGSLDDPNLSDFERSESEATLRRTIASIWGSDEIRRKKPTPQVSPRGRR